MKKIVTIVLMPIFFIAFSCTKDNEELIAPKIPDVIVDSNMSTQVSTGVFSSRNNESISGQTALVKKTDGSYVLSLIDVKTGGPDLKVFLSDSETVSGAVNLGAFKGSGTTNYNIPNSVDVKAYKYVLIYCQQYSILFGVSNL